MTASCDPGQPMRCGRAVLALLLAAAAISAPSRSQPQRALLGIWTPVPGPRSPAPDTLPLTESARLAVAAAQRDAAAAQDCDRPGMPAMLWTPEAIEFIERGDRIGLRYAEWGTERVIYMNPASGPARQDHSAAGVSFGRWEGETLAVFTLYIDHPYFDRHGTPVSRDVTVLERYTPSTDGRGLERVVTVTDPATFTMAVTWRGRFTAVATPIAPRGPRGYHPMQPGRSGCR